MKEFKVVMSTAKEMLWEAKHNFVVTFWWVAFMSVHLQTNWMVTTTVQSTIPTTRFWYQDLKQYETDDINNPSHLKPMQ
jgi:hypothetical protein